MSDNLKPVILALIGVLVILVYAAGMLFGGELLVWLALALTAVVTVQIGIWSFAKH